MPFWFLFLSLLVPLNAWALDAAVRVTPEERAYLKAKGPIKMCVDPAWEPIEILTETGEYQGMAADYIQLIRQRSGLDLRVYPTETWAESMAAVQEGRCDLLSVAAATEERREYLNFTTPYLELKNALVGHKDSPYVESLSDLRGFKVGVVEGYAPHEILRLRYPELTLVPVKEPSVGLTKLAAGEIDYMNDYLASASYYIGKLALSDLKIVSVTEMDLRLGFAVRKQEPLLHGLLNRAVALIERRDRARIAQKWITVQYEQQIDYGLLWRYLGLGLALLAVIVWWNRRLAKEVKARKEAEEEALEARTRAVEASQAKSAFLANMSHEIRTPMNAVMGMVELVLQTPLNPEQEENLKIAYEASENLLTLIDDILDLSRIEAGKLKLVEEAFDPAEVIHSVAEVFRFKSHRKQVPLELELGELPAQVLGDAPRLRQVLVNLLGNAFKFTETGFVRLKVQQGQRQDGQVVLEFCVEDTGIGIEPKALNHIFESFSQANEETSTQYGGTGLGLAICRSLVEMMGGRLWGESQLGQGSRFFFTLRYCTEGLAQERKAHSPDELPLPSIAGLRLLVVEDNPVNRKLMQKLLKREAVELEMVENGELGLERLRRETFDLAVVDLKMPKMGGLELAQRLRQGEAGPQNQQMPLVALTAHAFKEDQEACLRAGMNDYLSKPINHRSLVRTIHQWAGR